MIRIGSGLPRGPRGAGAALAARTRAASARSSARFRSRAITPPPPQRRVSDPRRHEIGGHPRDPAASGRVGAAIGSDDADMISVASRDLAAKNTVFVTEIICFWFDQTKRHSVIISAGDEGARAEAPASPRRQARTPSRASPAIISRFDSSSSRPGPSNAQRWPLRDDAAT